jgi:hypothetical protein
VIILQDGVSIAGAGGFVKVLGSAIYYEENLLSGFGEEVGIRV